MDRKQIDLIIGKKVEKSEADADKNHRIVEGHPTPQEKGGEVGGRGGQMMYVQCPWDYAINYVYVDEDVYLWYRCWHCGNPFKV